MDCLPFPHWALTNLVWCKVAWNTLGTPACKPCTVWPSLQGHYLIANRMQVYENVVWDPFGCKLMILYAEPSTGQKLHLQLVCNGKPLPPPQGSACWEFFFAFQILSVNNQNFEHISHTRALEILRGTTHLSICVKSNLLGEQTHYYAWWSRAKWGLQAPSLTKTSHFFLIFWLVMLISVEEKGEIFGWTIEYFGITQLISGIEKDFMSNES